VPFAASCVADIGSDSAVGAIAAAVDGRPVRMVVQAAGLPAAGPLATIEPDALGRAVALKCGGLLRLVRAVDGQLVRGARIVALGGHFGSEPAPYACAAGVTNAALANLVRQLADAYGPRGITAHLVAPGPADTPRLRGLAATAAAERGVDVEEVLAERAAESPLGRLVTPDEVAWAVATLLAPEADALLGSTLALDMGARRGIF
jgi:NAD(P)-dependent dehydrogenase (short-subunit alcohol dehydrogenase family)